MSNAVELLQSCKYIYLGAISEPDDNGLRIVVLEATTGASLSEEELASEPDEVLRTVLSGTGAIEHVAGCRAFELCWESYIGYSVINESYSIGEPDSSAGKGRLLVEFERSNYLEYLSKATFATVDYPGPYKHWAIYCLNHTIDVASQDGPKVRVLPEADQQLSGKCR